MAALCCGVSAQGDPVPPAKPDSGEFVETPVGVAAAAPSPQNSPVPAAETVAAPLGAPPTAASGPFGFLTGISRSSNLLGDMWGLRTALSKYGMTLNVVESSEALGNVSGGARQGFAYEGLTTATLQLDTQRAFGLNGGLFNVSAEQIHGGNLSATNLMTLQTAFGIVADQATRFWEIWSQQKFGDALDV